MTKKRLILNGEKDKACDCERNEKENNTNSTTITMKWERKMKAISISWNRANERMSEEMKSNRKLSGSSGSRPGLAWKALQLKSRTMFRLCFGQWARHIILINICTFGSSAWLPCAFTKRSKQRYYIKLNDAFQFVDKIRLNEHETSIAGSSGRPSQLNPSTGTQRPTIDIADQMRFMLTSKCLSSKRRHSKWRARKWNWRQN